VTPCGLLSIGYPSNITGMCPKFCTTIRIILERWNLLMIKAFDAEELDYIKKEFEDILHSNLSEIVEHKNSLDKEVLDNMVMFLSNFDEVNKDTKLNETLLNTIYWGLGIWYWVDDDIFSSNDVEKYCGEMYAKICEKFLVSDEEEG
jgi:hypothetical protein